MTISIDDLGISQDELVERVVDAAASKLLVRHVPEYDPDTGEIEDCHASTTLTNKLNAEIKKRIDEAIAAIAQKHLLDDLEGQINNVVIQATNAYGETKGSPATFLEYIVSRAADYMAEPVDFSGKDKASSGGYHFKATQTRLVHAVHEHLQYTIETATKAMVKNCLSSLTDSLQEAIKIKLAEISAGIKVSATVPR